MRSELLTVQLGGGMNDGDVGALIELAEPAAIGGAWTWALFLGEKPSPKPRDKNGRVIASTDEQLKDELQLLARLMREIFSNPETTRDAAYFVRGYQQAYNDYAAGPQEVLKNSNR